MAVVWPCWFMLAQAVSKIKLLTPKARVTVVEKTCMGGPPVANDPNKEASVHV
jgi:hypothetical protein